MFNTQRSPSSKGGLGFDKNKASTSGTKQVKFVKPIRVLADNGSAIKANDPPYRDLSIHRLAKKWQNIFLANPYLLDWRVDESLDSIQYWAESVRQIPDKGDLSAYWRGISFEGEFLGTAPSYTAIRDLMLRLCHRKFGSSTSFYLLARLLTEERLKGLTVMVQDLPVIDMAKLVWLQIYEELDDTWAWVSSGQERQPDADGWLPPPRGYDDFGLFVYDRSMAIDMAYSDQLNTAYRSSDTIAEASFLYLIFVLDFLYYCSSEQILLIFLPLSQIILISSEKIEEVMADIQTKTTMEEFTTNDKANYYSGIASIMVNGKRAYELKGKFLDDLRDNAFSGTNRKDAVEHIEYFLKIVDPINLPNVNYERLRLSVFLISLVGNARKWFD
ncbi:hypothetical protein Tco_0582005 [Tanacetum coccineum]